MKGRERTESKERRMHRKRRERVERKERWERRKERRGGRGERDGESVRERERGAGLRRRKHGQTPGLAAAGGLLISRDPESCDQVGERLLHRRHGRSGGRSERAGGKAGVRTSGSGAWSVCGPPAAARQPESRGHRVHTCDGSVPAA